MVFAAAALMESAFHASPEICLEIEFFHIQAFFLPLIYTLSYLKDISKLIKKTGHLRRNEVLSSQQTAESRFESA